MFGKKKKEDEMKQQENMGSPLLPVLPKKEETSLEAEKIKLQQQSAMLEEKLKQYQQEMQLQSELQELKTEEVYRYYQLQEMKSQSECLRYISQALYDLLKLEADQLNVDTQEVQG